jgi:hypothetical protein
MPITWIHVFEFFGSEQGVSVRGTLLLITAEKLDRVISKMNEFVGGRVHIKALDRRGSS